jgi:predicted nucleic acid-binding protein
MLIVADTSPLNYLVLIEAVHILPALYGRIIVPPQVDEALRHADSPAMVRAWILAKPDWLETRAPQSIDVSLPRDSGEAAAIALAQELKADRLLIDERDGRRIAANLEIPLAGTLAVLVDGARAGPLDLNSAFERLHRTSFRAGPDLFAQMLAQYRANQA